MYISVFRLMVFMVGSLACNIMVGSLGDNIITPKYRPPKKVRITDTKLTNSCVLSTQLQNRYNRFRQRNNLLPLDLSEEVISPLKTPLILAIEYENQEAFDKLLEHLDIDIDKPDSRGYPPIVYAFFVWEQSNNLHYFHSLFYGGATLPDYLQRNEKFLSFYGDNGRFSYGNFFGFEIE